MTRFVFVAAAVYLIASVTAFIGYSIDKSAAERGVRRVPEVTLHALSLIGGWPGALLAQRRFRHKTRKVAFQVAFWTTVLINCAAVAWLCSLD